MCDVSFFGKAVVRGYHNYKDIWVTVVGELEELSCRSKSTNEEDRFAVARVKDSNDVGHVPRKISSICLRQSESIVCCVTGSR